MAAHLPLVSAAAFAVLCAVASVGAVDQVVPPFLHSCSTDNDTNGSVYQHNLAGLFPRLLAEGSNNSWFYKGSAGTGAHKVFGLIMCYADRDAAGCRECLGSLYAWLPQLCPGSRNVRAAYNGCVLQYSTVPIRAVASAIGAVDSSATPGTSDAVWDARRQLMSNLVPGIALSPLLLAKGSTVYSKSENMYGLAQCTKDLSATECTRCIERYISVVELQFGNKTAGSILGYNCYLRYQAGAFEITVPLTLASPLPTSPLPMTASPPPPQLPPGLDAVTARIHEVRRAQLCNAYCRTQHTHVWLSHHQAAARQDTEWSRNTQTWPCSTGPSPASKTALVIYLCVGAAVSLVVVVASSIWIHRRWRCKRAKILETATGRELEEGSFFAKESEMEDEFEKGIGPKRFRYDDLAIATDNFSDKQKLGEGGFGSVYRGYLQEMDLHVAVKRVSKGSKQGRKEYASEVRIISRLRHRNLVQLIGWCHSGSELLLVYKLMPNGSLDTHLHNTGNTHLLPWRVRHEIVLGLGSALLYLHEEWEQCVLHRDIKPSNVMLDASFHAKLGDFGLARLVDHARGSHTTELAGTTGYMDPECTATGRFSTQSDVYSFGVLLLEVACGRRPVVVLPDGAVVHLAQRVSVVHGRGMLLQAADPRLNGEFHAKEMECVLLVGLWCTHQDRSLRPSIREAVGVLRFEAPLPSLPERSVRECRWRPPTWCLSSTR